MANLPHILVEILSVITVSLSKVYYRRLKLSVVICEKPWVMNCQVVTQLDVDISVEVVSNTVT